MVTKKLTCKHNFPLLAVQISSHKVVMTMSMALLPGFGWYFNPLMEISSAGTTGDILKETLSTTICSQLWDRNTTQTQTTGPWTLSWLLCVKKFVQPTQESCAYESCANVVTNTQNGMERNGLFHLILFRILHPKAIQYRSLNPKIPNPKSKRFC